MLKWLKTGLATTTPLLMPTQGRSRVEPIVCVLRRSNTRLLIAEKFDGIVAKLADRIERKRSNVYALLNGARPFGEKLARSIEQTLNLEPYWLDQNRTGSVEPIPEPAYSPALTARERAMLADWRALTNAQRSQIESLICMLLGKRKPTVKRKT